MKSSYSFQDRGRDRWNQFPNVLSKTFCMIIWQAYQRWKLFGDKQNNIPPQLHKRGGEIRVKRGSTTKTGAD